MTTTPRDTLCDGPGSSASDRSPLATKLAALRRTDAPPAAFLAAVRRRRRSIVAGRITAASLVLAIAAAGAIYLQYPSTPTLTIEPGIAGSIAANPADGFAAWIDHQLELRSGHSIARAAPVPDDAEHEQRFLRPGVSDTASGLDDWLDRT